MNAEVLIVVDLQNDFCKGGTLEVPDADKIVPIVNQLMKKFETVIGTQDWHPEDHISFRPLEQGGAGWPIHCVAGTKGAEFRQGLKTDYFLAIVRKAYEREKDAYSAFEGTGLAGLLKERNVTSVYVCGLALDYCVGETALDAAKHGFKTFVLVDATRSVSEEGEKVMLQRLQKSGVTVLKVKDLKDF